MPTHADWAWFAGIVEGEGSFSRTSVSERQRRFYLRIEIGMTDEDIIRKILATMQIGRVNGPYSNGNPDHRPVWRWAVAGGAAVAVAERLLADGRLGERRRSRLATLVEDVLSQPPPTGPERASHCWRGHPYDEANTLVWNGRRYCRACNCIRSADSKRRRILRSTPQ